MNESSKRRPIVNERIVIYDHFTESNESERIVINNRFTKSKKKNESLKKTSYEHQSHF